MGEINYPGWPKGMDNIHADNELGKDVLRRAVNLDVLDSGKLRRRRGFSQALAAAGAHSLWSWPDGNAYFVAGNLLKRFNRDASATTLGTVATGADHLAYCQPIADTYFVSRSARGKITAAGQLASWGIDVPAVPPAMMPDAGVLDAGDYLAAITYIDADGRESGASALSSFTLAASGGIVFYGLPVPTQSEVVAKRVYLTTANGEVLYRAAEVAAGETVAAFESFGAELRTQYLTPPPLGTALAYCLGRLFIADGKTLWFTEALDFDHVDRRRNFYQFPAEVTLIAGAADGLYVCADKTYFIAGSGSPESIQREVFPFGAIAGTLSAMPDTTDMIWMTPRGAVIGRDGGAAEIVSGKLVSPGKMTAAASLVRESDSLRQFVVVGQNTEASTLQCGSYADAEIIRRAQ